MSRSLEPASEADAADAFKVLFRFCRAFSLGSPNPAEQAPFYRHALAHMPADLLREAVDRLTKNWRWGGRMPLPKDIEREVAAEYMARGVMLDRLKIAQRKAGGRAPNREAKPDPAKAQRVAAETKAAARSTRTPRAPGMTDADLKRAQDAWNREAERVAAESREDAA